MLAAALLAILAQEPRAVAYLEREIPKWSAENHCYSCHNNADAARALIKAGKRAALADTLDWLSHPERWESNRGNPASSDKKLARVQFTVALSAAVAANLAPKAALEQAAKDLAQDQNPDGAWRAEGGELQVGSPVTWGTALMTWLAAEAVERAGETASSVKAKRWLSQFEPKANLELAVAVLAGRASFEAKLKQGQNPDGGWGPYPGSPSEVFDTALALLALRGNARARQYLATTQLAEGGWPETTRPAGGQSYAQHISTTGWATLALLTTQ